MTHVVIYKKDINYYMVKYFKSYKTNAPDFSFSELFHIFVYNELNLKKIINVKNNSCNLK